MTATPERQQVLVTGATGFLGKIIVRRLLEQGFSVRALVRESSDTRYLAGKDVELVVGDISDRESVKTAMTGMHFVVHAAADTTGSEVGGQEVTVQGTENVLSLCQALRIRKLVYISSCSVYQTAGLSENQVIDEDSELEGRPQARGPYSCYKLAAERLVTTFLADNDTATVCLRPGAIYGKGTNLFPPMLGYAIRNRMFLVIGNGKSLLPLVHVENVADAISQCLQNNAADNKIFNVVDPERISKRAYVDALIRRVFPGARVIYLPLNLIKLAVWFEELIFRALRKPPMLSSYRLAASQAPLVFDGSKIMRELDWRPSINFNDAVSGW